MDKMVGPLLVNEFWAWRTRSPPRSASELSRCCSPIDALIDLIVGCRLRRPIPVSFPVWLAWHLVAHLRITLLPQRRPACRGDAWRLTVHTDVLQNFPHLGPVGDEGDEAHLGAAQWAQQREHLVDAGDQRRPQVVRWCAFGWLRLGWLWHHTRRTLTCAGLPGGLLRRCCHGRHCIAQRRVRCQHPKVAVPVGAWWRHQSSNTVD